MSSDGARAARFGTTADMGLRARAGSREELFRVIGEEFYSAMVDRRTVRSRRRRSVTIPGGEPGAMMIAWLNELIYLFEVEGFLARRISVRSEGERLEASLEGEAFDSARHRLGVVFKAATLHRLRVEEAEGEWRAQVVLDV